MLDIKDINVNTDNVRPKEIRKKSLNVRATKTTFDSVTWLSQQLNVSQADVVEVAIKLLAAAYRDKLRRQ